VTTCAAYLKIDESEEKLCCCCGVLLATEPNGMCEYCAKNCTKHLKHIACITHNVHTMRKHFLKKLRKEKVDL
jgi:hypothetical protein